MNKNIVASKSNEEDGVRVVLSFEYQRQEEQDERHGFRMV